MLRIQIRFKNLVQGGIFAMVRQQQQDEDNNNIDEQYEQELREENGDFVQSDEEECDWEVANRLRNHLREQIVNEGVEEASSGTFLEALEDMGLIRQLAPYCDLQSPLPRIRIRSQSSENFDNNQENDGGSNQIMIDIDIEMPDGVLAH